MSGPTSASVVVVGSINVDRTLRVTRHPQPGETVRGHELRVGPGGKGANQAVAAARAGARVRMIGRVGDDADGAGQLAELRGHGVDVTGVLRTPCVATGAAHIAVDDTGENSIIVHAGANGAVTPDDIDAAAATIRAADVLMLQLEIPIDAGYRAAQIAAAAGVRIVFNASPASDVPHELLRLASPLVVNELELAALGPVTRPACITLGSAGARWGGHVATPPEIDVVDTAGAGDAFAGALAASLAAGQDDAGSLRAAVEAGALACTRPGARGAAGTAE